MPVLRNRNGFVIITLGTAGLMMMIYLNAFISLYRYRAGQLNVRWSQFAAEETARSSFDVLEAALKRRMWEIPPDSNCLRSEEFGVSGTSGSHVEYEVKATFDVKTQIIQMIATGNFYGNKFTLQKSLRVMDASDFLIFSKATAVSQMNAGSYSEHNNRAVSSLVARSRRLYFEGAIQLGGQSYRGPLSPAATGWGDVDLGIYQPHRHLSHIFQAERLYARGGIWLNQTIMDEMDPATQGWLNPYTPKVGGFFVRAYQNTPHAFFTGSAATADAVLNGVQTWNTSVPGYPSLAALKAGTYPTALAGRGLPRPYDVGLLADSGDYESDPDNWRVVRSYTALGFQRGGTFNCYTTGAKRCASSIDFPNGFKAWKNNAGLDGVLLTGSEAVAADFTKISWENLEALEEEAEVCGLVLDPSSPGTHDGSHEDCDITDYAMLEKFQANPSVNPCERVNDLNLDTLDTKLANFDAADYVGIDPKRIMRRVIYLKDRTQVSQNNVQGIFPSFHDPAHPDIRGNVPIWLVTEKELILKPYQKDLATDPGPLVVDPSRRRIGYFNEDSDKTDGTFDPLSMVILSPERVTIITPTHVPVTFSAMTEMLNPTGGFFQPRRHTLTDYVHQEEDGFKWGYRNTSISNVALITNAASAGYGSAFALRGLWGYADAGYSMMTGACWFDKPGDGVATEANTYAPAGLGEAPSYVAPTLAQVNDAPYYNGVPPLDSRYYIPATWAPATARPRMWHGFNPWVFGRMGNPNASAINFNGLQIIAEFNPDFPVGKRDLNIPLRNQLKWREPNSQVVSMFLPDPTKTFTYTSTNPAVGYRPMVDAPCIGANLRYADNSATGYGVAFVSSMIWTFNFMQSSPSFNFDNLGGIANTALPTTYVRQQKVDP